MTTYPTVELNIALPTEQVEWLEKHAAELGVDVDDVMRSITGTAVRRGGGVPILDTEGDEQWKN